MNITQIIPTELAGFCDVATGECIVPDPPAGTDTSRTTSAPADSPTATTRDVTSIHNPVAGEPDYRGRHRSDDSRLG